MALPSIFQAREVADVGVIGGSGFERLFEGEAERLSVATPYGAPSDAITVGRIGGRRVAFLPRHGVGHRLPPHAINYRANLWALASLGVTRVIGPCAVGSLQPRITPGDFVVCDQLVDRTSGRAGTYFDGPRVVHISFADPYCPGLRVLAAEAAREVGVTVHERGTVVVIPGPRFSSRAESRWYSAQGWDVVNMTQAPEAALARELELCYVNLSLITDYDVGLEGEPDIPSVTVDDIIRGLNQNTANVRQAIERLLPRIPDERTCPCASALQAAVVS